MKLLTITRNNKVLAIVEANDNALVVVYAHKHWNDAMQHIAEKGISYPARFPLAKYNAEPHEADKLIHNIQGLYENTLGGLNFEWRG